MKKIALLLCCVLAVGLAGCSNNTTNSSKGNVNLAEFSDTNGIKLPITNSNVKLSVMTEGNVSDLGQKLFVQTVKDVTGVELEITTVPSANIKQKLQMLVASKQIPDIFNQCLDSSEMESLAKNDVIVAFDEHLKELPNFKQLFVDDETKKNEMLKYTLSDGHIYTAPGYNITRDVNHGFMYRKDIFDKLGIKPWTNTEEFYNALKQLKAAYPNSTPLVSKKQLALVTDVSKGWGINGLDFYFDAKEGKYKYSATQENFRQVLDFFNKLYVEGLIDPEFLTCTQASWTAKMTQNEAAFVTYDWIDRMDLFYEQVKGTNPSYDLRFGSAIGSQGKYVRLSKVGNGGLAVRNNNKSDVAMKLVDFLLSPAGSQLATLGVEGKSYQFDSAGKVNYLGFDNTSLVNISSLEEKYGLFTSSLALRFDPRSVYFQYTEKNKEAQDLVNNNNLLTDTPIYTIQVSGSQSSRYTELLGNIQKQAEQLVYNYILGSNNKDELWNIWLQTADKAGVIEMTDIYNASYQEQINR